jgi:hypothetical protein
MNQIANYHEFKLEVKAVIPGSLSSFIYAYCKTCGMPTHLEPAFIRKAISFAKLSRYVVKYVTNDFDGWYRANEDSEVLFSVIAKIINTEDNRTLNYPATSPSRKLISDPFVFKGSDMQYVLVSINQ